MRGLRSGMALGQGILPCSGRPASRSGIVIGERPPDLKGFLQIFRNALLVALGHAMQVALRMIVLGHRDFHLGVERQVVEVGRGLEDRVDVVRRDAGGS